MNNFIVEMMLLGAEEDRAVSEQERNLIRVKARLIYDEQISNGMEFLATELKKEKELTDNLIGQLKIYKKFKKLAFKASKFCTFLKRGNNPHIAIQANNIVNSYFDILAEYKEVS